MMRRFLGCALFVLCCVQACGGGNPNDVDIIDPDGTPNEEQRDVQSSTEEVPCRFELHPSQVDGETVSCGDLSVVTKVDGEEVHEIRVHYARFVSPDAPDDAVPLMQLLGGPGNRWGDFTPLIGAENMRWLGRDLGLHLKTCG